MNPTPWYVKGWNNDINLLLSSDVFCVLDVKIKSWPKDFTICNLKCI